MSDSNDLMELAIRNLSCSQKELAKSLGVSPAQITKWKKGEYMSSQMEAKLRSLAGIGDRNPGFVLKAGSVSEADKWDALIHFLADLALQEAETGYDTYPLQDEIGLLGWHTFYVLGKMGVELPRPFPAELEIAHRSIHDEEVAEEAVETLLERNPYSRLIYSLYNSLNDVYGFYAAYVSELLDDDELELMETDACNIEPCLLELAATKLEEDLALAPRFKEFKYKTLKNYEKWLEIVKEKAFRSGVPLRAELMELVHNTNDELGHEAEAESFGFNSSRVHPDVYMNEILCSLRLIHQVLPAIMRKLEIFDEFKVDESDFTVGRRRISNSDAHKDS